MYMLAQEEKDADVKIQRQNDTILIIKCLLNFYYI